MKSHAIYAVTSGKYSDYRIVALFSSKKLAKEFMATVKCGSFSDYNDIEEYELDPKTCDLIRGGYCVWRVLMLKNGDVEIVTCSDNDRYDVTDAPRHSIWRRATAPAYKGKGTQDALDSKVWAKTKNAAIKIVNEKRIQMIATGEWK